MRKVFGILFIMLIALGILNINLISAEDSDGMNNINKTGLNYLLKMNENFDYPNGLIDSSGLPNTKTINHGANWTSGKFGYGLSFKGDNYLETGESIFLRMCDKTPLSIGIWVKTTTISSKNFGNVIVAFTETGQNSVEWDKSLEIHNGRVRFRVFDHYDNSSKYSYSDYGTTNIADGKWHYITGVFDGTNVKLYVDGNLENSGTSNSTYCYNHSNVVVSFYRNDGSIDYFNGELDELSIWERELSSSEIMYLYNKTGEPIPPVPPVPPINPVCGNSICEVNSGETCGSCPADCGNCSSGGSSGGGSSSSSDNNDDEEDRVIYSASDDSDDAGTTENPKISINKRISGITDKAMENFGIIIIGLVISIIIIIIGIFAIAYAKRTKAHKAKELKAKTHIEDIKISKLSKKKK